MTLPYRVCSTAISSAAHLIAVLGAAGVEGDPDAFTAGRPRAQVPLDPLAAAIGVRQH